jgi:cytochrome b561
MASPSSQQGYSLTQIVLHWLIAALVIFQILFGEDIGPAYRAFSKATEPSAADLFNANLHVYAGIAIFVLAILRVAIRVTRGAPAAPADETAAQKYIAAGTHLVLYLAILVMPITGGVAWFLGVESAAEVHEIGKPLLIVFVTLHVLGALYQHFVKRSKVMVRMVKPGVA